MPPLGDIRSVPVPGCVDGWLALHERFGRLELAEVLEPARSYAWTHPAMTILVKRSTESRVYTMDFANFTEISGGGSLSSVTSVSASPSGLRLTATPPGTSAPRTRLPT